jgi:hypothetical protein
MIDNEKHEIRSLLMERKSVLSVVVIACGLGFAISTISSIAVGESGNRNELLILISLVLIFLAALILYSQVSQHLRFDERISSAIILGERNEPIRTERYEFMQDFHTVLSAVKAESKAIYASWENDPIVQRNEDINQGIGVERLDVDEKELQASAGYRLAEEMVIFIIIDYISTHLTDYFNQSEASLRYKSLERSDLPDFLMKNRIVNLLSTPLDQRDIFMDKMSSTRPPAGKVVSAFGPGGAYFSAFELTLPEGAEVTALGHNGFRIKTKRVDLQVLVAVTPFWQNLPSYFTEFYLRSKNDVVNTRVVEIRIKGRLRHWSVFLPSGWASYGWLDSLRSEMRNSFGFQEFLISVGWSTVQTMLHTFASGQKNTGVRKSRETGRMPSE